MTPAETRAALVEAMARQMALEHHVAKSFADIVERNKYVEATGRRYESECSQVLSALSAKLRALGLKIVPVEATEEMARVSAMREAIPKVARGGAITMFAVNKWSATVAAAPDVLGGPDAD